MTYSSDDLSKFISLASSSTYAGGGSYEQIVERPGFLEMLFKQGDWYYRDSYTGFYRSSGSEVVRFQNEVIWTSNYCGGMVDGCDNLAGDTFSFLKKAMLAKPKDKQSFRGPDMFKDGVWEYSYHQKGDVVSFSGHEEISREGLTVFSHDIIGGIIKGK